MRAGLRAALVVVAAAVSTAAACPLIPVEPDAGPEPLVCEGGGDKSVDVGHTGVDFVPIEEDDELPSWRRPQGGLGSSINVKLFGYSDDDVFQSLQTELFGAATTTACTGTVEGECLETEVCDQGLCRPYICSQTNRTFPLDCLEDGTQHVPEMHVRFRNSFGEDDLDGLAAELRITATPREGDPVTTSVNVVLKVGEFIRPSWWEN